MKVISVKEIVECNQFLEDRGMHFRIHLRDACGKQSCWIEPLPDTDFEEQYQDLYKALDEFFGRLRYVLDYSEDKRNFWIG